MYEILLNKDELEYLKHLVNLSQREMVTEDVANLRLKVIHSLNMASKPVVHDEVENKPRVKD